MEFTIEIRASAERTEGKFASREELSELIIEGIDEPSELQTGDDATYEVTVWEVEDVTPAPGAYTDHQALDDIHALINDLSTDKGIRLAKVQRILKKTGRKPPS